MHLMPGRRPGKLGLVVSALLLAGGAWAQVGPPVVQTPREEFALPPAEVPEERPLEPILPPVPAPSEEDALSAALRVYVREFRITGNSVFSGAELAEVVAPYTGREITSAELQAARQALTLHYVERGYVNSGAVIPDQKLEDGVVDLRIIEGHLTEVQVEGTKFFRPSYFEKRLMIGADRPLQVRSLEQRLQLFQQDRRIRRLSARLGPGAARGDAVLKLRVEEEIPLEISAEWTNDRPASIGEQTGRFRFGFRNLTGNGDQLLGMVSVTQGLLDGEVRYRFPLNKWDTAFEARFRSSDSTVIEEPFDITDIESPSMTVGVGLLQPLYRTPATELRIALLGEWRRSETTLDGEGFSFPGSGADIYTGISKISVLRIGGEWIRRTRRQVLALRSLINAGLPVLGATDNPGDIPDSDFVSWLTQFQWAQRFPELFSSELIFRTDLQISHDPLMPLEQIAVGGMRSVRGYRENQIVRDQAVIASLEARIPVLSLKGHVIQLAPFADIGHGWNVTRRTPIPDTGFPDPVEPFTAPSKTLASLGIGLRYRYQRRLLGELYWGAQLSDVPEPSEKSLQDHGIHFLVRVDLF
jgi:hemolysin activation/secretion protein